MIERIVRAGLVIAVLAGSVALADDGTERVVAPSASPETRTALIAQWRALGPDYRARTEHRLPDGSPRYINRLIGEASPYLLQHAHNPIDWWPWGEQAFERARAEDKPVFLSIGYATCHWCHVMERESFEDEAIAELMNRHFISIKVDREQLPDVDALFMTAVQMITGGGGWPMSSFLDTDARPFYGGTYFPPAQFTDLLERVTAAWATQRPDLLDEAGRIAAAIDSVNRLAGRAEAIGAQELTVARAQLLSRHDEDGGGFGSAPKFPQESSLRFLLDQARRTGHAATLDTVVAALRAMSDGGIHDQIGGGFHRYAVDRYWQVPHFEKMLYNQAGLGRVYAEAAWLSGDADLAETARRLFDYVLRDMRSEAGLFYSATDADSEGGEGAFFTWTPDELLQALGDADDAELAGLLWDIDGFGNFEGETIPTRVEPLSDIARRLSMPVDALRAERAALAERLRQARERREKPLRDEKLLTGWNGLMIAALADASVLLDEPRYLDAASTAAEALWQSAHGEDAGLRRVSFAGRTEIAARQTDYAWFADALLALHDADAPEHRATWLSRAAQLADEMHDRFLDEDGGGYFMGEADVAGTALLTRPKDLHDASTPSGNGVALQVLARLATRTGERRFAERADALIVALSGLIGQRRGGMSAVMSGLADRLGDETGAVRSAARGKVRLSARPLRDDPGRVEVVADLAPGWHLNAAEPLQDYLIGTQLSDAAGRPLSDAQHPDPVVRTLAFQSQPLALYEGRVRIVAELPEPSSSAIGVTAAIEVQLQACDDRVCLAPETVRFLVPAAMR